MCFFSLSDSPPITICCCCISNHIPRFPWKKIWGIIIIMLQLKFKHSSTYIASIQGRIQQVAEGAQAPPGLEKLFVCVSLIGRLKSRLKSLSDLVLAGWVAVDLSNTVMSLKAVIIMTSCGKSLG